MKGQCFIKAFEALEKFYHSGANPVLVHGVVTGEGKLEGVKYTHAWVEIGDHNDMTRTVVVDNTVSEGFTMPAIEYYKQGKIQITKKYTYKEALAKILDIQHWGPWDEIFDNYL